MILMWLGSLILMLAGLQIFRSACSRVAKPLQNILLNLPEENQGMMKVFFAGVAGALGQGSFLQSQYGAAALLNTRAFSRRYGMLLLCLSGVGLWTTLLAMTLAWNVNGFLVLGFAVLFYLTSYWWNKGKETFQLVLGLGLFLVGAEFILRQQGILMSVLGESELHFLLADGRFGAQLVWLLVSFVITAATGFEAWSIFTSLALLMGGSLSLNGAVAFVIGEMLAHVAMLWWRTRDLNQDLKKVIKMYSWLSVLGLVVAFFLAGWAREVSSWSFSLDANQSLDQKNIFIGFVLLILVTQAAAVMAWGHFDAQKKYDEVQKGEYFSVRWSERGLISENILKFIETLLGQRLDVLLRQKSELDAKDRMKIPAAFLKDHEQEILRLEGFLRSH